MLFRSPIFESLRAHPEMDLASIYELLVILYPVTFVAHEFFFLGFVTKKLKLMVFSFANEIFL